MWDALIIGLNQNSGAVQGAVGIVLLLTLVAVIWYAWETMKMRVEMQKQRLESLRPILDVALSEPERGSGKGFEFLRIATSAQNLMLPPQFDCSVSNLGVGPAVDVEVSIVHELQVFNTEKIGALAKQSKTLVHFQGSARGSGQPDPEGDRIVARYRDVWRLEWKSQRKLINDLANSRVYLGPLKVSRA